MVIAQSPEEIARTYLFENAESYGWQVEDIAELTITDQYTSKHSGVHHLVFPTGLSWNPDYSMLK